MTHHTNPRSIEESLATNRAALSGTLDALRDRLSMERLSGDAVTMLGNHATQYVTAAERVVRANPWAVAMTGAGLAWLVFGGKRRGKTAEPKPEQVAVWEDEGGPVLPAEDVAIYPEPKPTFTEKHPAILGAVAMGIGVAIASAMPRTPTEDQTFGGESDELRLKTAALWEAKRKSLADLVATVTTTLMDGILESVAAAVDEASDTLDKVSEEITESVSDRDEH